MANQQTALQLTSPSDAVLDRLMGLHPKVIDLSLDRVWRLLERLGHPERALPPVVHVAGTNGKGSTIAYLRAMLEAAGRRVHVYTSPHLVRFHERIRLAGSLIPEDGLVALLEECEAVNGETPITFFEVTTVAAILGFSRSPADVLLLETGLGGRLDATNVVERPLLSVISPVSIDHVHYLGETVAEIAAEKAGILRPEVQAVIAPQPPEALAVLEQRAAELGTPLYRGDREWSFAPSSSGFEFSGEATERYPQPCLMGRHQIGNAALALAVAERMGRLAPDAEACRAGLQSADWPGRLQRLERGPFLELLPEGVELWLDGAHNEAAGEALAAATAAWREQPLHVIYGMLNTKAAEDFVRMVAPCADSLHAVAIPGQVSSYSAEEAAQHATAAGARADSHAGVPEALAAVAETIRREGRGRVLICGSLYLVGWVLAQNA